MHRSAFFWVSAFFILLAMAIFVLSDGFVFRPRLHSEALVPDGHARGQ
jgi:hypothetical protein